MRPDAERSRLQPRSRVGRSDAFRLQPRSAVRRSDALRLQPWSGPKRCDGALPLSGRSTCTIETPCMGRSMCGAWQPGGLLTMGRKIPGFASPPRDGFAVFSDRTVDSRWAAVCRDHAGHAVAGQWDESPVRCLAETVWPRRSAMAATIARQPLAGLDDATGSKAGTGRLARGVADEDAPMLEHRRDRRRIERAGEIEALRVL